jgi:general nucleoside transport system permease protein
MTTPFGLRLERRLTIPAWLPVAVPIGSMAAALVICGVILLLTGHNPFSTYSTLFSQGFTGQGALTSMLQTGTPLLFTGLAAAAAFRMGVFNLGGEGQLYIGAMAASGVGLALGSQPTAVIVVAMVAAAGAGGLIWSAIPGVLKAMTGTSELITSLMLNYVAGLLITYLIYDSHSYWRDLSSPSADQFPQGKTLSSNAAWPSASTLLSPATVPLIVVLAATATWGWRAWRSRQASRKGIAVAAAALIFSVALANATPAQSVVLPLGFGVGLLACIGVWVLYRETRFGYEARVVGDAPGAARYAAISQRRKIIAVMVISGAIAAVGGASQIGDFGHVLDPRGLEQQALGYTGIVVAALARFHPLSVPVVALVLGGLTNAGFSLQGPNFPSGLVGILQGALVLCTLAGSILGHYAVRTGRGPAPVEAEPIGESPAADAVLERT